MERTSQWDIVVVGGAYTDFVVRGSHLPTPGEAVQSQEFLETPGGKGANQAVAAARLGAAHVALVACIGMDQRGDENITHFEQEGIDTRYIVRAPAASGMSLLQVGENGQTQRMCALGASQQLSEQDVYAAADAIRAAKVLLLQLEVPTQAVLAAAHLAHEAGTSIIFDPSPPENTPEELLPLVHLIKPDAEEAKVLTGIQVQNKEAAHQAAQKLLQRGVRAVAIEAGEEGDLIVSHEHTSWLPRLPVQSIDATGAGDAFIGALAVAHIEGRSLEEAGLFASVAAALTTTKLGARPALPRRQDVMNFLAHLKQVR